MPKPPVFTPKPAIDKLPLAVRKDLRDNFESKKADFDQDLSDLLGFPMTFNFDINGTWAYAEEASINPTRAGGTYSAYCEGMIAATKGFVDKFGDLGKEYFKDAVTESQVVLVPNELGESATTITMDVKDGSLRIIFQFKSLGYNCSWLNDPLIEAINNAPRPGFNLQAKQSMSVHYDDEIDEVKDEIEKYLNMQGVILDPNFEENYSKILPKKKDDKNWYKNFGKATYEYFSNFKANLKNQGFDGDDMLQEGFAEVITTKTGS
jgi:hypothetical protein